MSEETSEIPLSLGEYVTVQSIGRGSLSHAVHYYSLATLWVSVACFGALYKHDVHLGKHKLTPCSVVVLYDWALVFDREVAYIWRRGWSSASLIYLTLRYVTVGSFILTMLDIFPYPGKSSAVSTSFDR